MKEKMENQQTQSMIDAVSRLKELIGKLEDRVDRWEQVQSNQSTAGMQQFHALEIAMKGYAKDIQNLTQSTEKQFQHWAGEIDRLWESVVAEIAPDVFRVSDKRRPKK